MIRKKNLSRALLDGKYTEPLPIEQPEVKIIETEHDWMNTPIFKECVWKYSEMDSFNDSELNKTIVLEIQKEKEKMRNKLKKQKKSKADIAKYSLSDLDLLFLQADDQKLMMEALKRSLKSMLKLVEVEYAISLEKK